MMLGASARTSMLFGLAQGWRSFPTDYFKLKYLVVLTVNESEIPTFSGVRTFHKRYFWILSFFKCIQYIDILTKKI
jgi:hypothetical protein